MYQGRHRPPRRLGFTGILRQREFGLLWLADAQSLVGDQLARVALSVLVFDRTKSGIATAAVYALTFLPEVLGSLLLGRIADVVAPRLLLVTGDLLRAAIVATMAIPGMPLAVVAVLVALAVLVGTPWKAAERALVVRILTGEDYVTGTGLRNATLQGAQLIGFAVGGVIVAGVGTRIGLTLDAATFAVSGLLMRFGLQHYPPLGTIAPGRRWHNGWLNGARSVLLDKRLRTLLGLDWILGLLVVPEGLAAPYAAHLGAGPRTVGLLLAAMPAGVLIGSLIFSRWVSPGLRERSVGPLAAAAGLPLMACALNPHTTWTLALWTLTGICTAYQIQVFVEIVRTIPPSTRGSSVSFLSGALLAVQGLGVLLGGAVLSVLAPSATVAVAGASASVLGAWLAISRRRHPVPIGSAATTL